MLEYHPDPILIHRQCAGEMDMNNLVKAWKTQLTLERTNIHRR